MEENVKNMNKVISFAFFYFIIRDIGNPRDPHITLGFMRQTGYPWKSGKGLQIRIRKYVLQLGVCRSNKEIEDENDGLLYAMQGRLLEEKPGEIGSW